MPLLKPLVSSRVDAVPGQLLEWGGHAAAMGLGNLQSLPKGFNASKRTLTDWKTYGKINFDDAYIESLKATQLEMRDLIQNQIRAYQLSNRLGGK